MRDRGLRRLALLGLVLAGCGGGSDAGRVFVPGQGHPPGWADPLAIGSSSFHGTAVKEVPPAPPGPSLFLVHCAACHGEDAKGKIGPNIQGAPPSLIDAAIGRVPLMRGHSILTEAQRRDISGYLASLADRQQPVAAVTRTDLCMECHGADLDGGISRVSCFACHRGPRGDLGHPVGWTAGKDDPVHFHGSYGEVFVAACTNCHGIGLRGGIGPACASCHNGAAAPLLTAMP